MGIEGEHIRLCRSRASAGSDASSVSSVTSDESATKQRIAAPPSVSFKINPYCDDGLQAVAQKCLKLCIPYQIITHFIRYNSDLKDGCVLRAFCGALDELLTDHSKLIVNLETKMTCGGGLTLQQILLMIQDHIAKMSVIGEACQMLAQNEARGGKALGLLHTKAIALTGQSSARKILIDFVNKASIPYFVILQTWVYHGQLADKFGEFFILEGESAGASASDFPIPFHVDTQKVPAFLEALSGDILKAGYYRRLIHKATASTTFKIPPSSNGVSSLVTAPSLNVDYVPIVYDALKPETYAIPIQDARNAVAAKLLDMMLTQWDLMSKLRSLKHFYLMDRADFFVIFVDMAQSELQKSFTAMIPLRLSSLLDLAIRTSTLNMDSAKDIVQLYVHDDFNTLLQDINELNRALGEKTVDPITIQNDQMFSDATWGRRPFAYEGISIQMKLGWPLGQLMGNFANRSYDLLFRFLFFSRMVERELSMIWGKRSNALEMKTNTLRHRMHTFIQSLNYYVNVEVIEPLWHKFMEKMVNLKTVDQVIEYHHHFLLNVLRQCMFFHIDLMSQIMRILYVAQSFAHYIMSKQSSERKRKRTSIIVEEEEGEPVFAPSSGDGAKPTSGSTTASDIDFFFDLYGKSVEKLRELIEDFKDAEARQTFWEVFNRIDFNGFYEGRVSEA